MKKKYEHAIIMGLIAVIAFFLFTSGCHGQQDVRLPYFLPSDGSYRIGIGFSIPLPGPTKYSKIDGHWLELTEFGFMPASTFPHPDTLEAAAISFEDASQAYLVQYDERTLTLYARKAYTIGDATWLSPCKSIKMGDKGSTMQLIPIITEYYELGRLSLADFCEANSVQQTPVAVQYWENCVGFYEFFKNIEQ